MDLDGAPVGDCVATDAARGLGDGLAAYLPFDGKSADNSVAKGPKGELCGSATVQSKDGLLGGCLHVAVGTNGVGGVRLGGSEGLGFENGTDFAMAAWVRLDGPQEIDSAIAGNMDLSSATNIGVGSLGVALVGARTVSTIKAPGVCLVGAFSGGRTDLGPCVVECGKWTFFAATRGSDGVLAFYQGGLDGYLYRLTADGSGLRLKSGLPFFVGQDGTGCRDKSMKGEIDEFALWTRNLSHGEVRRIYEAGRKGVALGDLL